MIICNYLSWAISFKYSILIWNQFQFDFMPYVCVQESPLQFSRNMWSSSCIFFRVQQDHIPSQTYRKSDKNSSSNNTKSMPDLKHSDLMQELKHRQEEIKNFSSKIGIPSSKSPSVISGASRLNSNNCHHDQEVKSFSSRFVSQTKPPPPSKTHLIFMAIFFFFAKLSERCTYY